VSERLAGQVALVTGGATGIGRAVVERFLAEGARVGVLVRGERRARVLMAELGTGVVAIDGDVRSAADNRRVVEATLAAFGRLDALIPNAGVWDFAKRLDQYCADELEPAFDELFDVNVKGALLAVAAARQALVESGGSVTFTISSSGSYAGGGGPVYVASKHAVVGLVRQLAFELAPEVRVNGIAPGATMTPLHGPAALGMDAARMDELDDFEARVARQLPVGFVSQPEDHASLYVLLAVRAESRFITGAVFPSDGGLEVRGGGRRRTIADPAGAGR
jgi:NAD(P)-dependent dehydrogenase (short-subunit alcohol dehydrogenase family)